MKRMITCSAKFPLTYRDYDIEHNLYGKGEYTVQYCGDDMWFDSLDEAKLYIDDIWKREIECATFISELSDLQQNAIRRQLRNYNLTEDEVEDAMNSKINDIVGNPECPIVIPDPVRTYQNRRNENKFIETKKYNDGHTVARQYMKWDTPEGEVKNYSGAKDAKRGRWHRVGQHTRDMMLEDYDEITSAEYVADDFSNDKIAFDSNCNFTEYEYKFYSDVFNEFGDWLEGNVLVDDWSIDIDSKFFHVTIVTTGGYVYDSWDQYLDTLPETVDGAANRLIETADRMILDGEPDIYPEDGEDDYDF